MRADFGDRSGSEPDAGGATALARKIRRKTGDAGFTHAAAFKDDRPAQRNFCVQKPNVAIRQHNGILFER